MPAIRTSEEILLKVIDQEQGHFKNVQKCHLQNLHPSTELRKRVKLYRQFVRLDIAPPSESGKLFPDAVSVIQKAFAFSKTSKIIYVLTSVPCFPLGSERLPESGAHFSNERS